VPSDVDDGGSDLLGVCTRGILAVGCLRSRSLSPIPVVMEASMRDRNSSLDEWD